MPPSLFEAAAAAAAAGVLLREMEPRMRLGVVLARSRACFAVARTRIATALKTVAHHRFFTPFLTRETYFLRARFYLCHPSFRLLRICVTRSDLLQLVHRHGSGLRILRPAVQL